MVPQNNEFGLRLDSMSESALQDWIALPQSKLYLVSTGTMITSVLGSITDIGLAGPVIEFAVEDPFYDARIEFTHLPVIEYLRIEVATGSGRHVDEAMFQKDTVLVYHGNHLLETRPGVWLQMFDRVRRQLHMVLDTPVNPPPRDN